MVHQNPYDMELERVLTTIHEQDAKSVCLQLADGLKPYGKDIADAIRVKFPDVRVILWGGSDFGGCDLPVGLNRLKVDLLIAFGHAPWVWGDELQRYK